MASKSFIAQVLGSTWEYADEKVLVQKISTAEKKISQNFFPSLLTLPTNKMLLPNEPFQPSL